MVVRGTAFATSREPLERRTLEMLDLSALISTDPFRALVERTVKIERIRKSDRAIRIAATNWKTGELRMFDNTSVTHNGVLASAAIPGIFPAIRIGGSPHVDGGILMKTPLKHAIDARAPVIPNITLQPNLTTSPPPTFPYT